MKTVLFTVALISALFIGAKCEQQYQLSGFSMVDVLTKQSDQNSCFMDLSSFAVFYNGTSDQFLNNTQEWKPLSWDAPANASKPANCSYQDFTVASFFKGETVNTVLPFSPPASGDKIINNTVQKSVIVQLNGTGCVLLPELQTGYDQYLCHLNYGGLPLLWTAFGEGSGSNFKFSTNNSAMSSWVMQVNQIRDKVDQLYNKLSQNITWPAIVANLYDACGSTNNKLSSLNVMATVSSSVDLNMWLPGNVSGGIWLQYAVFKPNGGAAGVYHVFSGNNTYPLFNMSSNNSCWELGYDWSDFLPNMNYCANGCAVTFILTNANGQLYLLETNGICTGACNLNNNTNTTGTGNNSTGTGNNSTGTGNNTGTGTGNNTGSNTTNNTGTGTGNNNNTGTNNNTGIVSNSAGTLAVNAILAVIIGFVYMALN